MTTESLMTKITESTTLRAGILAMAAGFILQACGGSETETAPSASTSPSQTPGASSPHTDSSLKNAKSRLVFDDLDGGSSIVRVYPGVTQFDEDKQSNGTFNDGDMVTPVCKTTGRLVNSVPNLGERNARSDKWIKIAGSPGLTQYATAVYIEKPAELLRQLSEC